MLCRMWILQAAVLKEELNVDMRVLAITGSKKMLLHDSYVQWDGEGWQRKFLGNEVFELPFMPAGALTFLAGSQPSNPTVSPQIWASSRRT